MISHNDLLAVIEIIKIAAKRGAFNDPSEYMYIGSVYSRLHHQASEAVKTQATDTVKNTEKTQRREEDNGN